MQSSSCPRFPQGLRQGLCTVAFSIESVDSDVDVPTTTPNLVKFVGIWYEQVSEFESQRQGTHHGANSGNGQCNI